MKPEISFEFFPPKTEEGVLKLRETRKQLALLNPKFFSVTFGAGGSTRDRTMDAVLEIQAEVLKLQLTFLVFLLQKKRF